MVGYLNGSYLPREQIAISPDDRGFLFSDGLYEVIRSYDGTLFQAQAHLDRLNYGAQALRLNTVDFRYLIDVAQELIQRNHLNQGDATVYLQVTRGIAPRTHRFPCPETPLTIYATASSFSPKNAAFEDGISVILFPDQRWARCDIKTVSLIANVLAHQQARDYGASEAIFVRDGVALEGTHSNFFGVFKGTVVTAPKTNYILGGITRQVVLDLCKDLSIPFQERPILEPELQHAEELMVIGTITEITPIVTIDNEKVGSGRPGTITRRLHKAFREFVTSTKKTGAP
ncbi:MAG TPA: aminotransferase class IV [Desulfatiglandales bacterium]|nr:aminotransferase class IV [Desulfatiglandales bacterium]